MTIPQSITIEVQQTSDRLDRYLAQNLPDISRARIQKLIEEGNVLLNQQVCTSKKASIQIGDQISVTIPAAKPLNLQAESIPLDILYEDDELLIINKPAGLVVHPAPGHESGTLVNALLAHCHNLTGIGGIQRPGIVHRLDKDTTGAIAIAKTDHAHHHLIAQLKAKTARREYLGIVYGSPATTSGTINQPIGRHPIDRKKMAVVPQQKGGREAITHWQIKERLGNYTLIHFQLETGRTHQIRVHTAHIGHPIVGDPLYSKGRDIGVNLPGQALHAWRLRLKHPHETARPLASNSGEEKTGNASGEWIEVIAPLPPALTTLLDVLRRRAGLINA